MSSPFTQGCGARGQRVLGILGSLYGSAWAGEKAAEESTLHLEGARDPGMGSALCKYRKPVYLVLLQSGRSYRQTRKSVLVSGYYKVLAGFCL